MTDINPTGPTYPAPPAAGSNAIGKFAIGVGQIGDIPEFSYWDTVASQYANSSILTGIIGSFFAAADQTQNLDNFFDAVWNLDTAQDYGLDFWGRVVGINRVIQVPTTSNFGFAEAAGSLPFNTNVSFANGTWVVSNQWQGGGSFYAGTPLTQNYSLSNDTFRNLILTKAAANITDGSIKSINQTLLKLFPGRGNAYVTDGYQGNSYFGFAESQNALPFGQGAFYNGQTIQSMVMTFTFNFPLSPVELAIVNTSGVLPKPTGVQSSIVINVL